MDNTLPLERFNLNCMCGDPCRSVLFRINRGWNVTITHCAVCDHAVLHSIDPFHGKYDDEWKSDEEDGTYDQYYNIQSLLKGRRIFDALKLTLTNGKRPINSLVALDLGCGPGKFVDYLIAEGITAYGVDKSSHAIRLAKSEGRSDIQVDILDLPERCRDSVSILSMLDVIEHIDDPYLFLRKNIEALPNVEYLIITVPNRSWWPIRFSYILSKVGLTVGSEILKMFVQYDYSSRHLHYFSPASVAELMNKVNFRPIVSCTISTIPSCVVDRLPLPKFSLVLFRPIVSTLIIVTKSLFPGDTTLVICQRENK